MKFGILSLVTAAALAVSAGTASAQPGRYGGGGYYGGGGHLDYHNGHYHYHNGGYVSPPLYPAYPAYQTYPNYGYNYGSNYGSGSVYPSYGYPSYGYTPRPNYGGYPGRRW
jgi:hypothetical protein